MQRDFTDAIEKIVLGTERQVVLSQADRERTAYHEAGHALVGMLTPGADPVRKVSIIPRGQALGVTLSTPEADQYGYERAELLGRIRVMLGGRAAEQVVYGEMTTGAESDIQQLTRIARSMVGRWGMSDAIGPVAVAPADGTGPLLPGVSETSEHTQQLDRRGGAADRRGGRAARRSRCSSASATRLEALAQRPARARDARPGRGLRGRRASRPSASSSRPSRSRRSPDQRSVRRGRRRLELVDHRSRDCRRASPRCPGRNRSAVARCPSGTSRTSRRDECGHHTGDDQRRLDAECCRRGPDQRERQRREADRDEPVHARRRGARMSRGTRVCSSAAQMTRPVVISAPWSERERHQLPGMRAQRVADERQGRDRPRRVEDATGIAAAARAG